MSGGHGHAHGAHGSASRLRWVLAANAVLVAAQVGFGLVAHSVGLLADAAHNLVDVAAVAIALGAVVVTRRPPTGARSYGWLRGSVLAAQANAAAVVAMSVLVFVAAFDRLRSPRPVDGAVVLVVAGVAFLVNGGSALLLRHDHDLATRSAWLHLAGDAVASLVVAVAGGVIAATGRYYALDPVASAVVAALVLVSGVRLLKQANAVLLEGTPHDVSAGAVASTIAAVPGVESVHDLHVWSLDGVRHALSAHVVVAGHPTLEEAQAVATEVKRAVSAPFGIAHATVELECEGCVDDGKWCAFG